MQQLLQLACKSKEQLSLIHIYKSEWQLGTYNNKVDTHKAFDLLKIAMSVSYTHLDVYKRQERDTINNFEAEGIIFAACDDGDGTNLITGKLSPFVAAELLYNLQRNLRKCFQQRCV